jgi:hypothetical protein
MYRKNGHIEVAISSRVGMQIAESKRRRREKEIIIEKRSIQKV